MNPVLQNGGPDGEHTPEDAAGKKAEIVMKATGGKLIFLSPPNVVKQGSGMSKFAQ